MALLFKADIDHALQTFEYRKSGYDKLYFTLATSIHDGKEIREIYTEVFFDTDYKMLNNHDYVDEYESHLEGMGWDYFFCSNPIQDNDVYIFAFELLKKYLIEKGYDPVLDASDSNSPELYITAK